MKSRFLLFIFAVLSTILACANPGVPPDAGGEDPANVPIIPTDTPPFHTATSTGTFIPLPTLPDSGLSFAGPATPTAVATATVKPTEAPTSTPTNTSLPPLPDYDNVVGFSLGGGGDFDPCAYKGYSPAVFGQRFGLLRNTAILCVWGVMFGEPFQIKMVSPDGQTTLTENFMVDPSTTQLLWQDHGNAVIKTLNTSIGWQSEGPIITIGLWWSSNLPSGVWRVEVIHHGATFTQGEFRVEGFDGRKVSVVDPHSWREIIPMREGEAHGLEHTQAINGVDVIGDGFTSNSYPVILLFRQINSYQWDLIYKSYAPTDARGVLNLHIPGPLNEEYQYLLAGLTEAGESMKDENGNLSVSGGMDLFNFKAFNPASLASCPGAPPQRMVVNRRGSVCTQRDTVRLRDQPARSASTIVFLPVGTQFTVLRGPSCADNWSWWQIQTDNGYSGWISEGGDNVDPYFICPLP